MIRVVTEESSSRDIRGALYGSRLIELPHVRPEVDRCLEFLSGEAPALVEVGFDHGRRLNSTARLNPDWQILGLEVRRKRVDEANARAERDGIGNLMAWRMDARTVFACVLQPASVELVEVLFPTPWWNRALREKRLLIEEGFVADVARVLRPGGLFHVATDVGEYAEAIASELGASPLERVQDPSRPACTQKSRREWACERDGIPWMDRYWRKPN